jgi:hypothetical protein
MNVVNITVFAIFILVLFAKNWIPSLMGWIQDRVRS